jgi:hypothetical protein
MAPHDTNPRREARRHRWPLIGITVILILVAIGFFWYVGYETEGGGDPVPGSAEIEDLDPAPQPAN